MIGLEIGWSFAPTLIEIFIFTTILILPFVYEIATFKYFFKHFVYYSALWCLSCMLIPYFALFSRKDVKNLVTASHFCRHISTVLGLKWEMRGKDNLEKERACVIIANHQSSFDVLGMFHLWPTMKKCTAVAKHELLYTGPFGIASWLSGLIFINRIRSDKARDVINQAVSKLKVQNIKLWVFPEGTRRNTGKLHAFKKGAFHVAIAGQIPLLPVVFSSYKSFLDDANKNMVSGDIIITTLEPIPTEGLTADDIPELMERCHNVMLETFLATTKEIEMRVANRRNPTVIDAATGKNLEKTDTNETILPNQRIPNVN